jgi:hypothetical protein
LPDNPGTIIPDEASARPPSGKMAAKFMYNQTRIISLDYRTEARGFDMLCRNGSLRFNVDNLETISQRRRTFKLLSGMEFKAVSLSDYR